jgi:hypothetical protein
VRARARARERERERDALLFAGAPAAAGKEGAAHSEEVNDDACTVSSVAAAPAAPQGSVFVLLYQ